MAFRNVQAGMATYRGQGGDRGDAYYAHPTNAGPHPGISRLRSCSPDADDLPAIGGRAEGMPYDTMYAQCMYARGYRVPGFSPSPDSPGYQAELPGPALYNEVPERAECENVEQLRRCGPLNLRRSSWLLFPRRLRPTASLFPPR
jgi:hypothetical protein